MTDRATHDSLSRDLGHLEGRVDEIRDLVVDGFKEVKELINASNSQMNHRIEAVDTGAHDRLDSLDARVRATETAHASKDGAHSTLGGFVNAAVVLVSSLISWALGHWLK